MRQACAPRPRGSQAAATASPSTFPSNTTPLGGSVPERVWVILSLLSLQGNETHHSAPSPSSFHPGMHPNGLFLCSETINTHRLSRQFSSATEAKPLVNKYNIVFYKSKKKAQRRHLATREASLWHGRRKPGSSVSQAALPEASLPAPSTSLGILRLSSLLSKPVRDIFSSRSRRGTVLRSGFYPKDQAPSCLPVSAEGIG